MVRFSHILLTYFIIGAVMFGGGAISLDETGVVTQVIDEDAQDESADEGIVNNEVENRLDSMGGPIGNIIGTVGGGLLAIWNFVSPLINIVFWPPITLNAVGAPFSIVVLGGALSMAFIAGLVDMVRGSA